MKRKLTVLIVAMTLSSFVAAQSQALTRPDALKAIASAPNATNLHIAISGISQASSAATEAIVLATIDGDDYRLQLRHYDTGWKWEGAEGDRGVKLSVADVVSASKARTVNAAAAAWLAPLKSNYQISVQALEFLHADLPRLKSDAFDNSAFAANHDRFSKIRRATEDRAWILAYFSGADAWGTPMKLVAMPDKPRSAVAWSAGPDRRFGTDDDIACIFTGFQHFDSDRSEIVWDYHQAWKVPLGVDAIVRALTPPEAGVRRVIETVVVK